MKKITTILLAAALLTALTGCDNNGVTSDSESTNSTVSTVESTSTESGTGSTPESKPDDSRESLLAALKVRSYKTPDGNEIFAEDAVDIYKHNGDEDGDIVLKYDFAYIRYASPSFYAGDMLDDAVIDEWYANVPEAKWFQVKAGDKLDCGLTVKKAEYERYAIPGNVVSFGGPILNNTIEFDGEITLEGVLYTAANPNDYLTKPGDLIFAPDPTKTNGIPAITNFFDDPFYNIYYAAGNSGNRVSLVMSDIGTYGWLIGKADEIDKDEIFGDCELAFVKVTLTNVKAGGYTNPDMPTMYAEIVDIERND